MAEYPEWNQLRFYKTLVVHTQGRKWLELGCGRGTTDPALVPLRSAANESVYVGVGIDHQSLVDSNEENKVLGDASTMPFPDSSFDLISSNMVFEHLPNPSVVLKEARRLLTLDGILIVHTPSSSHYLLIVGRILSTFLPRTAFQRLVSLYEGRKQEDIFPTWYRANTTRAVRKLARDSALKVERIQYLEGPYAFPRSLHAIEKVARKCLPDQMKSTMLVLLKRVQ